MKFRQIFLPLLAVCLLSLAIHANENTQGEKLFNDPLLGGGITGKTCSTCHADGEGISSDFDKKTKYTIMGLEMNSLPEVINNCIEITLRGESLNPEGPEMKAIIAHIRTLKNPATR